MCLSHLGWRRRHLKSGCGSSRQSRKQVLPCHSTGSTSNISEYSCRSMWAQQPAASPFWRLAPRWSCHGLQDKTYLSCGGVCALAHRPQENSPRVCPERQVVRVLVLQAVPHNSQWHCKAAELSCTKRNASTSTLVLLVQQQLLPLL